jgi:hypothetical protein
MKHKSKKEVKKEGLPAVNTCVTNTPVLWGHSDRQMALANAQKAAAKRDSQKLVKVDAKTWVYG